MRLWACGQRGEVVLPRGMWPRCPHVHNHFVGEAHSVAPDAHRRPVAERLVWAPAIVESEPLRDAGMRFAAVGIVLQIDVLIFERAPQPLDEDVVHAAPASVHRDSNASIFENAGESRARELAALIAVEISGGPERARASSRASTQNDASIVFDSRHDNTARLAQSMIATR